MWPIIAAAAGAFGSKLIDRGTDKLVNKVPGIPTPQEPQMRSGGQIGQETLDYYNAAFPGTSPAERLGHSPSNVSGIQSSEEQIKSAQKMQDREFRQENKIADKKNITDIITATTGISAAAQRQAMEQYTNFMSGGMLGGSKKGYRTMTTMAGEKLNPEIANIKSGTAKNLSARALDVVNRQKGVSEKTARDIENEYLADAKKAGIDRDRAIAELSHAEAVATPYRTVGGAISNIGSAVRDIKGASVPSITFKKRYDD